MGCLAPRRSSPPLWGWVAPPPQPRGVAAAHLYNPQDTTTNLLGKCAVLLDRVGAGRSKPRTCCMAMRHSHSYRHTQRAVCMPIATARAQKEAQVGAIGCTAQENIKRSGSREGGREGGRARVWIVLLNLSSSCYRGPIQFRTTQLKGKGCNNQSLRLSVHAMGNDLHHKISQT